MTGPAKVAAVIVLCVVALVGLNLAMWRRARAAVAEGYRRQRAAGGGITGPGAEPPPD